MLIGGRFVFTVDLTGAGLGGDLEVDVDCLNRRIPTHVQSLGTSRHRYEFVPASPYDHTVSVKYNEEDAPGYLLTYKLTHVT